LGLRPHLPGDDSSTLFRSNEYAKLLNFKAKIPALLILSIRRYLLFQAKNPIRQSLVGKIFSSTGVSGFSQDKTENI